MTPTGDAAGTDDGAAARPPSPPAERGSSILRATGGGAARGAAAGLLYAVLFAAYAALAGGEDPLTLLLVAVVLAVPVGAVAGAVLGALLLPFVRRFRRHPGPLVAGAALVVLAGGLLAFPAVPLGALADGASLDRDGTLMLRVLPAVLGALAAAHHTRVLLRREPAAGAQAG